MNQRTGDVVIAYRGAGALVGGWAGNCLHRQQFRTGIVHKGDAEPRTERWRDERQFGPARRARALAIDRLAAGNAQRRQRDVEREFWKMRERVAAGAERAAQMFGDGAWW